MRRIALLAAGIALAVACGDAPLELNVETACEDTGNSIASRTFTCTEDFVLSNKRFDSFTSQYSCTTTASQPLDELYACPVAINGLPCERVTALGDDIAGYLSTSTVCATFLKRGGM